LTLRATAVGHDPPAGRGRLTTGPIDHRNDTRALKALLGVRKIQCDEMEDDDGKIRPVPRIRLHDLRQTAASLSPGWCSGKRRLRPAVATRLATKRSLKRTGRGYLSR
jgi:hypothetical protein